MSLCVQLPHLPHISEGLMKRSLRRGDMRDMSLGQLQVITNDLHSQIQSEYTQAHARACTQKLHTHMAINTQAHKHYTKHTYVQTQSAFITTIITLLFWCYEDVKIKKKNG